VQCRPRCEPEVGGRAPFARPASPGRPRCRGAGRCDPGRASNFGPASAVTFSSTGPRAASRRYRPCSGRSTPACPLPHGCRSADVVLLLVFLLHGGGPLLVGDHEPHFHDYREQPPFFAVQAAGVDQVAMDVRRRETLPRIAPIDQHASFRAFRASSASVTVSFPVKSTLIVAGSLLRLGGTTTAHKNENTDQGR